MERRSSEVNASALGWCWCPTFACQQVGKDQDSVRRPARVGSAPLPETYGAPLGGEEVGLEVTLLLRGEKNYRQSR